MKKLFCFFWGLTMFFSCKRDINQEIKDKITDFYITSEAKNYEAISYSDFDTIKSNEFKTTGTVKHVFQARSNNGKLIGYSEIFDVTVFDDTVIVLPRSFNK
jgi:hypothetical protein